MNRRVDKSFGVPMELWIHLQILLQKATELPIEESLTTRALELIVSVHVVQ